MSENQDKPVTEKHYCVRCGIPTESHMGDVYICDTCYEIRGSCCPEFGADDLTTENDTTDDKDSGNRRGADL